MILFVFFLINLFNTFWNLKRYYKYTKNIIRGSLVVAGPLIKRIDDQILNIY